MKLWVGIRAGCQATDMLGSGKFGMHMQEIKAPVGMRGARERLLWHDMSIWGVELGMEKR